MDRISMIINGKLKKFVVGKEEGCIHPEMTLLELLREGLRLTAAKEGCNRGACGNCTVIMNGEAVPSCMVLAADCDGAVIKTLEGLEDPITGEMNNLQKAFVDNTAFQCGFCTPGIVMSAQALLDKNPEPTESEIREALSGNFCRCISHYQVFEAVEDAIDRMKEKSAGDEEVKA